MIYKPQNIRKRATGKLARTSYVNEVVDALPTRAPVFGQMEPDSYPVQLGVLAHIDSNRTRYGCYKAYILNLLTTAFNVGSAVTFTSSDFGNTTSAVEITLINMTERGQSTHALTAGGASQILFDIPAMFSGRVDENGKPIYYCAVVEPKLCT